MIYFNKISNINKIVNYFIRFCYYNNSKRQNIVYYYY